MYLAIDPQKSCSQAWLAAIREVERRTKHEAHNVVIDVTNPTYESSNDRKIRERVDDFSIANGPYPLQTVSNTIFPQRLYEKHGHPDLYREYLGVYKHLKRTQKDWGRYFERMIDRQVVKDGRIETINPLENLIKKLKKMVHGGSRIYKNIYELDVSDSSCDISIYDPTRDAGPVMGRQCLSFLSFKLGHQNQLMLTAVYRNHYYIARLLGNLIGLARLMAFIAKEVEIGVGALTVVSTHAYVDTPQGCPRSKVKQLLADCEYIDSEALSV